MLHIRQLMLLFQSGNVCKEVSRIMTPSVVMGNMADCLLKTLLKYLRLSFIEIQNHLPKKPVRPGEPEGKDLVSSIKIVNTFSHLPLPCPFALIKGVDAFVD